MELIPTIDTPHIHGPIWWHPVYTVSTMGNGPTPIHHATHSSLTREARPGQGMSDAVQQTLSMQCTKTKTTRSVYGDSKVMASI